MIRLAKAALLCAAALAATPAIAGEGHGGGGTYHGGYQGGYHGGGYGGGFGGGWVYPVMPYQSVYTVSAPTVVVPQDAPPQGYPAQPYPMMHQPDPHWQEMMERCAQPPRADNGVGGALIGGLVGGVVGNRIADGDRALGTIAGAAVGAVAGAAIDKAEDKGAERALREECDAWFAQYGPPAGYGGYPGAGYGYPGYIMVPVMLPAQQKPCVETTTVTEEWVDVPVRQRSAPRRAVHRDKRVKEKRVYTGS